MKVLIITPLELEASKEYENNKIAWINKQWEKYQEKHPECLLNLEFEYRIGTDLEEVNLYCYYYFCEQDIDKLKEEIQSLIQINEIIGLIIDPILTLKEEEMHMYSNTIPGNALETIFNAFNNRLPIFYYGSLIGSFFDEPLCERINEDYRKKGYTRENGYIEIPHISRSDYLAVYESMFDCFIDFYSKKQEENLKFVKIKKGKTSK